MKAKVITIANHKGGVGKTTSTASIGVALSIIGKRVLLIDLDAQQNLSFTLTQTEDPEVSVYDSLVKDTPLPVVNVRENLDLVPASLELGAVFFTRYNNRKLNKEKQRCGRLHADGQGDHRQGGK